MHYLDPDAFRPHTHDAQKDDYLYHVYDNMSQTPYKPGDSINAGDPNTYIMSPDHIITHRKIMKHLDWRNREPTYFISMYKDRNNAINEARRRMGQRYVPGEASQRDPNSVRIAVISVFELHRSNVFYFSRSELMNMLQISSSHEIFRAMGNDEWLAMDCIPNSAVIEVL